MNIRKLFREIHIYLLVLFMAHLVLLADVASAESVQKDTDVVHGLAYNVSNPSWSLDDMRSNHKKLFKDPVTQRYLKKPHRKKVHAQGVMLRRSVFEKYGLFWDICSKSDKEFWYRIGLHPLSPLPKLVKAKKIEDFVSYYRRHKDSMKSSLREKEKQHLKDLFNQRIRQLKNDGITKKNTDFL